MTLTVHLECLFGVISLEHVVDCLANSIKKGHPKSTFQSGSLQFTQILMPIKVALGWRHSNKLEFVN